MPREITIAASGMSTPATSTMVFQSALSEPNTRCVIEPISWLPSAPKR